MMDILIDGSAVATETIYEESIADLVKRLTWASAIALVATRIQRAQVAKLAAPSGLHIYGDEGWATAAPTVPCLGVVDYPEGLPSIYRAGIHLNTTSFQMPTAVNQRVFDIPAAGGVLLTDLQSDLETLFNIKDDCITFSHPEELSELIVY